MSMLFKMFLICLIGRDIILAQNSDVEWYVFNGGFNSAVSNNTSLNSGVGEIFIGKSKEGNTIITSGFYGAPILLGTITDIEEDKPSLYSFTLEQNFPNPFNPSTKIKYSVPTNEGNVTLKVYDILGNELETLVNEDKLPGVYEVTWNAKNVSSGVYFYRIKAGTFMMTRKMILIR